MAKIIWTKLASKDIILIHDFIAKDSPFFAKQTVEQIFERVSVLTKFQLSGRIVPEFKNKIIRELIYGNYRIVYRTNKEYLSIIRVHHSAQDITNK